MLTIREISNTNSRNVWELHAHVSRGGGGFGGHLRRQIHEEGIVQREEGLLGLADCSGKREGKCIVYFVRKIQCTFWGLSRARKQRRVWVFGILSYGGKEKRVVQVVVFCFPPLSQTVRQMFAKSNPELIF